MRVCRPIDTTRTCKQYAQDYTHIVVDIRMARLQCQGMFITVECLQPSTLLVVVHTNSEVVFSTLRLHNGGAGLPEEMSRDEMK